MRTLQEFRAAPIVQRGYLRGCATISGILALVGAVSAARGQIILDGTMGAAGARVGPNYIIPQSAGRVSGTNLFHSFSQFNINSGESATFTADSGTQISNVVARVTGPNASNINGLLRSDIPGAHLFLINPNGIVFGPEAQLDVQGSFVASTASYVRLADGTQFSAVAPSDAVLTSSAPSAFGFLPSAVAASAARSPASSAKHRSSAAALASNASITVTADSASAVPATLSVPNGQSLALIGGAVRITGGRLVAVGGRVDVTAVAGSGEVKLDVARPYLPPDTTGVHQFGTVEILDGGALRAPVGGSVTVDASSLTLRNASVNIDTDSVLGGIIDLFARDTTTILNSGISAETVGTADSGAIFLTASALAISGLSGDGKAAVEANTSSSGRGGNITLNVATVAISKDGSVQALANGSGRGGDISVNASKRINIDADQSAFLTGFAAETAAGSPGDGGNIVISAPRGAVEILRGGQLTSTTKGSGNAGTILVTARALLIDGEDSPNQTLIQARVGRGVEDAGASGQGGPVEITARDVILKRGGVITATTFGSGRGGDIQIDASDQLKLVGSAASEFTGVFARSSPAVNAVNVGRGGDIELSARQLTLSGPAAISAQSTGGTEAGSVKASADVVRVNRDAAITVEAPAGKAGDLSVSAASSFFVDHGIISAQGGTGGNINLNAGHTFYALHGMITARADGDGGKIIIDPPAVVLDGGTVINGLSGNLPVIVRIDGPLLKSDDSQIRTNAGIVFPETDLAGQILPVIPVFPDAGNRLVPQCGLNLRGPVSSFIITGRGGEPPAPDGWMPELRLDLKPASQR